MPTPARLLAYLGIGVTAGFLSGLFGVGGGVLIVPALMLLLGMPQKLASGTSLVAVAPLSIGGMLAYAAAGHIDWVAALVIAAGAVAGGAIGSLLLDRLPAVVISWVFIGAIIAVAVQLFFEEPTRGVSKELTPLDFVLLVLLGLIAGVLSGLIGVGGGIIIVPALIVLFDVGDLSAKGASLVALVPNAISTSVQNLRRRNADLVAGLTIGLSGAALAVLGAQVANWIDPRAGAMLFGAFLLIVAVQLIVRTIRQMRRGQASS